MSRSIHLRIRVSNLAERERGAWTDKLAGRDGAVTWRYDTLDGRLVIITVESTTFGVRT
jgi:hypothetical protein